MLEFQEKKQIRRLMYSKVTLVILLIILIFSLNSVWNVYKKYQITKINLDKTASTFAGLQDRKNVLLQEIDRLHSTDGQEEEIREKYGLVKPNEEVIIIVPSKEKTESLLNSKPKNFWQKIKAWLE